MLNLEQGQEGGGGVNGQPMEWRKCREGAGRVGDSFSPCALAPPTAPFPLRYRPSSGCRPDARVAPRGLAVTSREQPRVLSPFHIGC